MFRIFHSIYADVSVGYWLAFICNTPSAKTLCYITSFNVFCIWSCHTQKPSFPSCSKSPVVSGYQDKRENSTVSGTLPCMKSGLTFILNIPLEKKPNQCRYMLQLWFHLYWLKSESVAPSGVWPTHMPSTETTSVYSILYNSQRENLTQTSRHHHGQLHGTEEHQAEQEPPVLPNTGGAAAQMFSTPLSPCHSELYMLWRTILLNRIDAKQIFEDRNMYHIFARVL